MNSSHALAAMAALALLSGCHRGADWREQAAQPAAPADPGYAAPPEAVSAQRLAQGGLAVSGRASPGVRVRLATPAGQAYGATAGDDGVWTIPLPPGEGVRLYGLAEDLNGRLVQAEGYVALLPSPEPKAVLLRAGTGARTAGAGGKGRLLISAVDFDSGAAVVSGLAKSNTPVRLQVDGAPGGEARTDAQGRYSMSVLAMLKPGEAFQLKPGAHDIVVESGKESAKLHVVVSKPEPIRTPPYHAQRTAQGWRIDWMTPGGGVQTTLALDAPGAAE